MRNKDNTKGMGPSLVHALRVLADTPDGIMSANWNPEPLKEAGIKVQTMYALKSRGLVECGMPGPRYRVTDAGREWVSAHPG